MGRCFLQDCALFQDSEENSADQHNMLQRSDRLAPLRRKYNLRSPEDNKDSHLCKLVLYVFPLFGFDIYFTLILISFQHFFVNIPQNYSIFLI